MYQQNILPPCSNGCPVNTNVSGYIDAITGGDYKEAFRLLSERNPFSTVCGWVCPHPCEDNCRRGQVDKPLSIRALKRFAIEQATETGSTTDLLEYIRLNNPEGLPNNLDIPGGDVAVIGAGPSGLAAAFELANRGYSVTVFEKQSKPGGHFYTSLPLYRLPRRVLQQDIERIEERGVNIICGVEAGTAVSVETLRQKYKAVIIAAGLQVSRSLPLPGFDHSSVLLALPFLQSANSGNPMPVGNRVLVIGGGNVAMDVARTAVRLGAERVESVCLESPEEMPANPWEIEEAYDEGVIISCSWGPEEIIVENGKVKGLQLKKVTSVFDCHGRFCPTYDENVKNFIEADTIIVAVGQMADLSFLEGSGIPLDQRGNIKVDRETFATPVEGVFTCGEVAAGPGAAISAVASGQKAAKSVDNYLRSGVICFRENKLPVINTLPEETARKVITLPRQSVPAVDPLERKKNFLPFEQSYKHNEARLESSRCMRCGLGAVVIEEKCAACLTCVRLCPFGVPEVDGVAIISTDKCQGCGICASVCPAGAIEMTAKTCGEAWVGKGADIKESSIAIYICRYIIGREVHPNLLDNVPNIEKVRIKVLPSADSLDRRTIMKDIEDGKQGVALIACNREECLNGGQNCTAMEFKEAKKLVQNIGLDSGILKYIAAGDNTVDEIAAFIQGFKGMHVESNN